MSVNSRAETSEDPAENSGRVQSVDRAISLLRAVASSSDALTALALADACGLNRSTAWRLLLTLEHHGLVDRDPETNRYRLGLGVLKLVGAVTDEPLIRRAKPLIRSLAEKTRETVSLAVPHGGELVYVDQAQTDQVVTMNWSGMAPPLHATSTGKAFLAALSDEDARKAIADAGPLVKLTDSTVTDVAVLGDELLEVQRVGYAVSRGEYEPMVWGVSAAVVDNSGGRPLAVVSLTGTEHRFRDRIEELASACMSTAHQLTRSLAD